ncbi:hypothetical protein Fmac_018345 [Flemingia macrophylla]|uniref:Uncharacterized protein n=1 Tax=Flemingia macrophylla TaxID=520843 RepID=A0ABD1M4Q3_9FABA
MHKPTHPCGGTYPTPPQILRTPKNDAVLPPTHDPPSRMLTYASAAASSCLRHRHRRIRFLLLLLCSPLLLLLLCAALPFLCAADLCLRRRLWRKLLRRWDDHGDGDGDGDPLQRCEEGCSEEEKGLLHRYLEDQLLLVRSMYECGGGDPNDDGEEEEDSRTVQDVERLGSNRIPLLR